MKCLIAFLKKRMLVTILSSFTKCRVKSALYQKKKRKAKTKNPTAFNFVAEAVPAAFGVTRPIKK